MKAMTVKRILKIGVFVSSLSLIYGHSIVWAQEKDRSISIDSPMVTFGETVTIGATIVGRVKSVLVQEGDRVKSGACLLKMEDHEQQSKRKLQLEKANSREAELFACSAVEQAEKTYRNAVRANESITDAIPVNEVERRNLGLLASRRELDLRKKERLLAKLELDIIEAELANYQLNAPFDSFVRQRIVNEGATVRPDSPLLELVRLDSLRVEGYVSTENAISLERGLTVVVRVGERKSKAKLVFIDVSTQQVRQKVRVWAALEMNSAIRAGEEVEAWIAFNNDSTEHRK